MRLSLLLINAGLVAVTMVLGEQVSANWQYDPVYGGLTQYATPQSQLVNITRNGIGRHPTKLDYNEGAVTYDFQDNVAGQRAMRTRSATGVSPAVSHFVFGGLNPMVEFEGSDKVHYTVAGAYITVGNDNTVRTQYAVRDRLQSTRALLDENLAVSAQFGYDTLGKPTENDQACTDSDCSSAHHYPYRFQGHQYLAWDNSNRGYQPGVTDNKDRFYSHDHGLRFMNTDAAGASISPYTAYGNDPINFIDLTGFIKEWAELIQLLWLFEINGGLSTNLFFGETHDRPVDSFVQLQLAVELKHTSFYHEAMGSKSTFLKEANSFYFLQQKKSALMLDLDLKNVSIDERPKESVIHEVFEQYHLLGNESIRASTLFYSDAESTEDLIEDVGSHEYGEMWNRNYLKQLNWSELAKTVIRNGNYFKLIGGEDFSGLNSMVRDLINDSRPSGLRIFITGEFHALGISDEPLNINTKEYSLEDISKSYPNKPYKKFTSIYDNSIEWLQKYGGFGLSVVPIYSQGSIDDPRIKLVSEYKLPNNANPNYKIQLYRNTRTIRKPNDLDPGYQGPGNNNKDDYGNDRPWVGKE
jgi:hypothetical protein